MRNVANSWNAPLTPSPRESIDMSFFGWLAGLFVRPHLTIHRVDVEEAREQRSDRRLWDAERRVQDLEAQMAEEADKEERRRYYEALRKSISDE